MNGYQAKSLILIPLLWLASGDSLLAGPDQITLGQWLTDPIDTGNYVGIGIVAFLVAVFLLVSLLSSGFFRRSRQIRMNASPPALAENLFLGFDFLIPGKRAKSSRGNRRSATTGRTVESETEKLDQSRLGASDAQPCRGYMRSLSARTAVFVSPRVLSDHDLVILRMNTLPNYPASETEEVPAAVISCNSIGGDPANYLVEVSLVHGGAQVQGMRMEYIDRLMGSKNLSFQG